MKKPGDTVRSVSFCCQTPHGPRLPVTNGRHACVQVRALRLAIVLITGRLASGSRGRLPERSRSYAEIQAYETFTACVSKARRCAGVADLSWLPADLVDAADHRLTLTAPTSGDGVDRPRGGRTETHRRPDRQRKLPCCRLVTCGRGVVPVKSPTRLSRRRMQRPSECPFNRRRRPLRRPIGGNPRPPDLRERPRPLPACSAWPSLATSGISGKGRCMERR